MSAELGPAADLEGAGVWPTPISGQFEIGSTHVWSSLSVTSASTSDVSPFSAMVSLGQMETLSCESVYPGRGGAPEWSPAVTAELTESQVVDVEEQDVRPIGQRAPLNRVGRACQASR
jgi:hypothetical protein